MKETRRKCIMSVSYGLQRVWWGCEERANVKGEYARWHRRWSHGVVVSTQDFESCDPSSNLGGTSFMPSARIPEQKQFCFDDQKKGSLWCAKSRW